MLTLLVLCLAPLAACSDDGGTDATSGGAVDAAGDDQSRPSSLEDLVGTVPGLSEITEPEGTGPLLGTDNGEEVRVADVALFCQGYGAVAAYRDDLATLLDAGDQQGALDHISSGWTAAQDAAGQAQLSISGGMDLDMVPWSFVATTEQWAYDGLDVATMQERLAARAASLTPFDEALAQAC
jgi:hypothetical protein